MLQLGATELGEEIDSTLNTNPLLKEITPQSSATDSSAHDGWLENLSASHSESFEDHLITQLGFVNLNRDLYFAACIIISLLDDNGYLTLSDRTLKEELAKHKPDIDTGLIEAAKNSVRQLDPAGVASTDLNDCLKQQLSRYHRHSEGYEAAMAICDHLELLADDPGALLTRLNLDQQTLDKSLGLIKGLEPVPSRAFDPESAVYLQPDILVSIDKNELSISINPTINRQIEINMEYVRLLKKSSKPDDRAYLKNNLNSARWWMNALAQRNLTMMRVAEHMITTQSAYFTGPKRILKPLTQKNIADSLNLHVSTVSRAIKDKTVQAPEGILSLNTLLAGRLPGNGENVHSNQSVKVILSELIKNEPSQTPLSDSKITSLLNKRGIRIARRTVSKYREQLNIPASNLRRIK